VAAFSTFEALYKQWKKGMTSHCLCNHRLYFLMIMPPNCIRSGKSYQMSVYKKTHTNLPLMKKKIYKNINRYTTYFTIIQKHHVYFDGCAE
jgi:hypothetical protein